MQDSVVVPVEKSNKGFASMSPERLREVGSRGGKNATRRHAFSSEEAREAGAKGLQVRRERRLGREVTHG